MWSRDPSCKGPIGHSPLGLFRTNINRQWQLNIQINMTGLRIPTGGMQTSWLFTRVAEKLNSGLLRTSTSCQNEIWTHDLRISNLTLKPLAHAAAALINKVNGYRPVMLSFAWSEKIEKDRRKKKKKLVRPIVSWNGLNKIKPEGNYSQLQKQNQLLAIFCIENYLIGMA